MRNLIAAVPVLALLGACASLEGGIEKVAPLATEGWRACGPLCALNGISGAVHARCTREDGTIFTVVRDIANVHEATGLANEIDRLRADVCATIEPVTRQ